MDSKHPGIMITPKDQSHYHHGNLREALIQTALQILAVDGVAGLTLRKVAKAAGVSHAAPAHHFKDKTALVASVAAEGFRILSKELLGVADIHQDSKEQLIRLVRTYVGFAQREVELFRLIFGPSAPDYREYPELYEAGIECWNTLVQLVITIMKDQEITNCEPDLLAFSLWAHTQGVASLIVNQAVIPPHLIPIKGAMQDKAIELLIDGIIAASRKSKKTPDGE
ncbi:MAG TPA: TetR/AcrR family transcriptional regulator [Patescibacteria group bacterium]|nr:TetR/AcrR family transcriptional regulator [Patescibacteria group bacterium]